MILGGVISIVAAFTPINDLAHMTSFGTFFAFLRWYCVAVWILRKRTKFQRNFKVPALPIIVVCGILINVYLIINLSIEAQTYSFYMVRIRFCYLFPYTVEETLNFKMVVSEKL